MDWSGAIVIAVLLYMVIFYSYNTHKLNKEFADEFSSKK